VRTGDEPGRFVNNHTVHEHPTGENCPYRDLPAADKALLDQQTIQPLFLNGRLRGHGAGMKDGTLEKSPTVESRGGLVGGVICFLIRREGMKPLFTVPILHQHFDFPLGIFQDFQATFREPNAFFEDLQRFVQRQITFSSSPTIASNLAIACSNLTPPTTAPLLSWQCEIPLYRARFRFTSTDRAARA
jgi:hypothetical protein